MNAYQEISSSAARAFCQELFKSYHFSTAESAVISDILLAADFAGIESHGIQRIIRYHEEITSGCVDVHAVPETVFDTKLSAVIDAHKAMGQLVAINALDLACVKARDQGFGIVSVRNANHIGICGYYTERAAQEGFIGICMTNTEAIAVPTFGSAGMLGTNPIAFAMNADPFPLSFDVSTTVVPRGKLEVCAKNNEPLPLGWAVDEEGRDTTNAAEVIDRIVRKAGGGILPLGGAGILSGGHKGFGLGILVEIFTGILSGGITSNHINRVPGETGICASFLVLDCALFGDTNEIKKRLEHFLDELRTSPKAQGHDRIFIPGERKAEVSAQRAQSTIPVNKPTLDELRRIAALQDVDSRLLC
ncbi:MAG: Ldh family oxidoreductase [Spirochaetaceae bacterium]|jgi:LDH2 family malate/lactate/ureidoglycolate dehydrogenase|nr:Ldh family oxidoreductase [Spirochaetaceae bacterium]